jgi:signal peptidase II
MTRSQSPFARPVGATLLILSLVALDQLIKYLVEISVPFEQPVNILPFLALYRTWNIGVAFSFLSGLDGWVIVVMRLAIVAFILWWWKGARQSGWVVHLGFVMIIAGAIGNIVDRLIYGHVIDYVLFHTQSWSFAVFNLADSLITVGAVVVGISEVFLHHNETGATN